MKISRDYLESIYRCMLIDKAKYTVRNKKEVWRVGGAINCTPVPYYTGGSFSLIFSRYIINKG